MPHILKFIGIPILTGIIVISSKTTEPKAPPIPRLQKMNSAITMNELRMIIEFSF